MIKQPRRTFVKIFPKRAICINLAYVSHLIHAATLQWGQRIRFASCINCRLIAGITARNHVEEAYDVLAVEVSF